jgi:hypothetical protein
MQARITGGGQQEFHMMVGQELVHLASDEEHIALLGNSMTDTIPSSPVGEEPVSNAPGGLERWWLGTLGTLLAAPPIRLVKYGQGAWRKRSLTQAFYEARLALGEKMYQAGIDDGQLGAQIRDLDERICRATATQAPSKALKLQQVKLILQLADAALAEEGPLPGADAEYQTVRKLEAALVALRSE